ncbi:ExeM/NucH family extracellular endonuclease [Uliginosibacterium sp. 31-16]|uniref:ExeM/NucH family extracellular endonuclease n=1 Tax=Uliginosibacterium sp. 31-16 TaxID=3068315 RepID=UPI00273FF906|nr:ExeM/NucH family extracellular endonuclease [Uliginosibacterium sp. 31-16]MDP5238981.1 ExeM/NucH family extracellular endonuclease [Uliginosibacterium sp. 31-16]
MTKKFQSSFSSSCLTLLCLLTTSLAACGGGGSASSVENSAVDSGNTGSSLPTCATPTNALQTITAVQGTTDTSPLAGQLVAVRGVVTGDYQTDTQLKGFFIQQPVADADPLTSEGIFVYAPAAADVKAGDYVQVEGTVTEYKASSDSQSLTEITAPTAISVCGAGLAINPVSLSLPLTSAAALEAYEGMLVKFEQPLTVSEVYQLGRYGELVLSANGRLYHPNNHPTLTAAEALSANALNQIRLDDGSSSQNPNPVPYLSAADSSGTRRVGDTVTGVRGPLIWSANAWRVHPDASPVFTAANPRPAAPAAVGGTLKVASLNVLNYFTTLGSRGANTAAEFTRQQAKLVEAIAGLDADVLGLMEIENNGTAALASLVTAVNARVGAGTYSYIDVGQPGTDAITVAMLYKPARATPIGSPQIPTDSRFSVAGGLRPPVAQRFAAQSNNGGFWMVVNHLKSKGSCPSAASDPDQDYGQGCWNASRTLQAAALKDWVATLASSSGEADMLMMGDFNSYLNEDPIKALEAAGHEELLKRLPADQRYTYVYSGESGVLDHAFASSSLKSQVSGVTVWHINAEEPLVLDYNTEYKTDDRYAATAYRSSDHDPVLVGLSLAADAAATTPTLSASLPVSGTAGTAVSIAGIVASNGSSLTLDWGDGSSETLALAASSASHSYASAGSYTITLTLTGAGPAAVRSAAITVNAASSGSTGSAELFFSEYIEGSSNNKALELYNPTGATIDLSAYSVKMYANGGTTATQIQALTGSLAAGETLILRHASFTTSFSFPASALSSSVTNFNGDDAVTLEKNGVVIDGIGVLGTDPGTEWVSGSVSTANKSLRRKSGITHGSVPGSSWSPADEWDGYDIDSFSGLGSR